MTTQRRILLIGLGLALVGAAVGEHGYRRLIQQRYRQSVEATQQLEHQFAGMVRTHTRLTDDLAKERQRAQTLSAQVAERSAQLEETTARLAQEAQTIRELQLRLAAMEQQMGQLQGELSVALQRDEAADTAGSSAVQLERILVSQDGSSNLEGRVISVHRQWNFVVIDFGWDAVQVGDTVSIVRNEELLAKAKVERVQEGMSAATILPEWETAKIQVNDRALLL